MMLRLPLWVSMTWPVMVFFTPRLHDTVKGGGTWPQRRQPEFIHQALCSRSRATRLWGLQSPLTVFFIPKRAVLTIKPMSASTMGQRGKPVMESPRDHCWALNLAMPTLSGHISKCDTFWLWVGFPLFPTKVALANKLFHTVKERLGKSICQNHYLWIIQNLPFIGGNPPEKVIYI